MSLLLALATPASAAPITGWWDEPERDEDADAEGWWLASLIDNEPVVVVLGCDEDREDDEQADSWLVLVFDETAAVVVDLVVVLGCDEEQDDEQPDSWWLASLIDDEPVVVVLFADEDSEDEQTDSWWLASLIDDEPVIVVLGFDEDREDEEPDYWLSLLFDDAPVVVSDVIAGSFDDEVEEVFDAESAGEPLPVAVLPSGGSGATSLRNRTLMRVGL